MTGIPKTCLSCRFWHPEPGQMEGLAFCTVQIGQTEAGFSCQDWEAKGTLGGEWWRERDNEQPKPTL